MLDRCMVAHWIKSNVTGASKKSAVSHFFMRPPMAHACTILLAYRHFENIKASLTIPKSTSNADFQALRNQQRVWRQILNKAWSIQLKPFADPMDLFPPVDVDYDCLREFEHLLFEFSRETGAAGNAQWGLDVGPCERDVLTEENGFNFQELPSEWTPAIGTHIDNDTLRKVRANFFYWILFSNITTFTSEDLNTSRQ